LAEYKNELDEPNSVTWLDDEEMIISDIWMLSVESGFSGAVCNYEVVKDSCRKYKFDTIDVFRVCKTMTYELRDKD